MSEESAPRSHRLAINALFPTFLFCRDYPNSEPLNAALRSRAYECRERDGKGRPISARHGWQSQPDFASYPEALPLLRFINETVAEIKEFLRVTYNTELKVGSCWANINGKGSYNAPHIHGNSHLSGVYYVQTPEGCGNIEFRDPNQLREVFCLSYRETTVENCFSQTFPVMAGRMFVFPGYLPHEVHENTVDRERISVSFNMV